MFQYLENKYDARNIMSKLTKGFYMDYSAKLHKICKDFGVEFYDMNKMLGKIVSAENWLFVDRAHLTDQGNIEVSELIYNMEQD